MSDLRNEYDNEEEEGKPLHVENKEENGKVRLDDTDVEIKSPVRIVPRLYKRRWFMVLLFATFSLSNAYQWIHLNIIGNIIMRYYNESLPGTPYQKQVTIDWLSMIYMLAYIPLIFPATWLLDRKGLRVVGICATFLNTLGAWIKCASVAHDRFPVLMTGQTICAIAQIFILGIPARLAAVWFGPDEVSTATAIGVFGNQVGCAVGFFIPPYIVPDHPDRDVVGHHLSLMFYGTAGVTSLLFVLVLLVYTKGPPVPPSKAQAAIVESAMDEDYFSSLKRLFWNKGFILLMVTYGINTGSYYGIGTLLNPIILHYFPGHQTDAGMIGMTLILAGVGGSIIAGIWLDRTKLFKATTVGIYFMSFVGMVVFTFTLGIQKISLAYICAGALGFFMTGYLPVGFEFAAELTYPESEGTSSGLLNAAAQTFGITFTLGMGFIISRAGIQAANLVVSGALLLGTAGTAIIKADLRRQRAGKAEDFDSKDSKPLKENEKNESHI